MPLSEKGILRVELQQVCVDLINDPLISRTWIEPMTENSNMAIALRTALVSRVGIIGAGCVQRQVGDGASGPGRLYEGGKRVCIVWGPYASVDQTTCM